MADKRISDLAPLSSAQLDADVDVLAVADISAAETKKITAQELLASGLGQLPEGSIDGGIIIDGTLSGSALEENSITERELAPNSVNTIHVIDGAVTNDKLAGGITADKLADGSIGPNQLQENAVDGALHIQDRSIPAIKLQQNTLTADEIAAEAIGSDEIADGAVGTSELADDACSTNKYQDLSVTNAKLADGIDGSKIQNGSITTDKLTGGIDGGQIDSVPLDKLPDAAANSVLAGPASGPSASPTYRRLVSDDLPTATALSKGAAAFPPSGGLSVSNGDVGITNTVVSSGHPFVNYNSHGLVTSGRNLQGTDLPIATTSNVGGVIVGDGLTVDGTGKVSQEKTGVVPGSYAKVTVNDTGHVTGSSNLVSGDIPGLDASVIISGQFGSDRIADKSIQRRHLGNYSIAYIQEATPVVDSSVHVGCLWFRESTAGLNMWNGNSWMNIGQGRLSAENLRYCGIVDASTGMITGVTQFGVGEGFSIGEPVPIPTDDRTGVYFVVETPGDGIAQTPGVTYDAGDWCLCNGSAAGWVRIDTLNGGGGGGGAQRLNDLLDVDVTGAAEGAMLQFQASGLWTNVQIIDAGDY